MYKCPAKVLLFIRLEVIEPLFLSFFRKKSQKVLAVRKKAVPLHPQIRRRSGAKLKNDWGMV